MLREYNNTCRLLLKLSRLGLFWTTKKDLMDLKASWIEKGFIDEPIPQGLDLKQEIRQLCEEKNAIILAHYYTIGELQDRKQLIPTLIL